MAFQSGHEIIQLTEDEQERYNEHFNGEKMTYVRLVPDNWFLLDRYGIFADKIYNFKFVDTDVLVMTFQKCGTTWTQEIIWTMQNNPNLCHPKAEIYHNIRAPFIEADILGEIKLDEGGATSKGVVKEFLELCPGKDPKNGIFLQMAEFTKEPRTFKTHLPFSLYAPSLLDIAKVVYVVRNPKDVAVSMYHHKRIAKDESFSGSLEDCVQLFLDDKVLFGPFGKHVKEAWGRRNHPNLHFIYYEDMKADPLKEIKRLDSFLETHLTENQMKNIVNYTSFSQMKARDKRSQDPHFMNQNIVQQEGGFFRKGEVGDWKNELTPKIEAKMDQWIEKEFSSFGFTFK